MFLTVEDTLPLMYNMPNGSLLEAGVYNGNTLTRLIGLAQQSARTFHAVFGYDSFQGLPKETTGLWENPDWQEGAFNVQRDHGLASINEAIDFIIKKVKEVKSSETALYLYPGFFEDTMTESQALIHSTLYPISYFHIDCDLHSSTKTCLEWALKYKIMLSGCIIRFDDIASTPEGAGQKLALKVAAAKFNVKWDQVADNVFIYRDSK